MSSAVIEKSMVDHTYVIIYTNFIFDITFPTGGSGLF